VCRVLGQGYQPEPSTTGKAVKRGVTRAYITRLEKMKLRLAVICIASMSVLLLGCTMSPEDLDFTIPQAGWEEFANEHPDNKYLPKDFLPEINDKEKREKLIDFRDYRKIGQIIQDPQLLPTKEQAEFYYSYKIRDLNQVLEVLQFASEFDVSIENIRKYKIEAEIINEILEKTRSDQSSQRFNQLASQIEHWTNLICVVTSSGGIACASIDELTDEFASGYWDEYRNWNFIMDNFSRAHFVITQLEMIETINVFDKGKNTRLFCDHEVFAVNSNTSTSSRNPTKDDLKFMIEVCREFERSSSRSTPNGGGLGGSNSAFVSSTISSIDERIDACPELPGNAPAVYFPEPGDAAVLIGVLTVAAYDALDQYRKARDLKIRRDAADSAQDSADKANAAATDAAAAVSDAADAVDDAQAAADAAPVGNGAAAQPDVDTAAAALADAAAAATAATAAAADATNLSGQAAQAKSDGDAQKAQELEAAAKAKKEEAEKLAAKAKKLAAIAKAKAAAAKKKAAGSSDTVEGPIFTNCQTRKQQWEFFKAECERTNGWDRPGSDCNDLIRKTNNCVNVRQITPTDTPTPDGDKTCMVGSVSDEEIRKIRCEFRSKFASDVTSTQEFFCADEFASSIAMFKPKIIDICTDPKAQTLSNQCTESDIVAPVVSPTVPIFGGLPPMPFSDLFENNGRLMYDSLGFVDVPTNTP